MKVGIEFYLDVSFSLISERLSYRLKRQSNLYSPLRQSHHHTILDRLSNCLRLIQLPNTTPAD